MHGAGHGARPGSRVRAMLAGLTLAAPVYTPAADLLLVNGRIITFDGTRADALVVRGERIAAVGRTQALRRTAAPGATIVDLGGRTVIPGLVDSHIHAIRAGLGWNAEVHWLGVRSLAEALERLRDAARRVPAGGWLVVAGGWTESQFAERRAPTQAEIVAAAPDHRVYVQRLYTGVLLSPGALEVTGVLAHPELASRLRVETDAGDRPTGWVTGDARTISDLFDLLPAPSADQQMAGTRAFFRALNALGVTGVIDPGGYNLPIDAYRALHRVARAGELTLRVAYSLSAPRRDHELEDFRVHTALVPMGVRDGLLRFNGIGENVTWGMYNNDAPTDADKARLAETLRWAAARGLTTTFHWNNDRSVGHLLDVLEAVDRETPIARLRWSIAHLNDASAASLARMRRLGVGWLVQDALFFRGEAFAAERGEAAVRRTPPIMTALALGIPVGAGTDAHRVMWHHPFVSLQWLVDGRTVAGTPTRGDAERPDRLTALRLYTQGSAWFTHDDHERGALAAGHLADLAVLDADYLTVPTGRIGALRSLLTIVNGRVVHAEGPFANVTVRTPEGSPRSR